MPSVRRVADNRNTGNRIQTVDLPKVPRGLTVGNNIRIIMTGTISSLRDDEEGYSAISIRASNVSIEPVTFDDAANIALARLANPLSKFGGPSGTSEPQG